MLIGNSSCSGIIFYDTDVEGKNGVYAYYENDEIQLIGDNYQALSDLKKEKERALEKDQSVYNKPLLYIFLFMVAVVIATAILTTGILPVIGALLFAAGGYMPILIIYMATQNDYITKEAFRQYRRYHGAEHTVVNYSNGNEHDWRLEEVRKASMYESECGTAYAQMFLLVITIAAVIVANISSIGIIKGLGILIAVIVVLFLNILFNPYNPFILLQRLVVETPGDRELLLAIACYQRFVEILEDTEKENIEEK